MFEAVGASLPASDLARAKAFYRDTLGLEPATESEDGSARYMLGETGFVLYETEFAGTNKATAAAFMVSDISAAVEELRGRGVTFEDYDFGEMKTVDGIMSFPDGTVGAWFKDTEGNILGVFQEA